MVETHQKTKCALSQVCKCALSHHFSVTLCTKLAKETMLCVLQSVCYIVSADTWSNHIYCGVILFWSAMLCVTICWRHCYNLLQLQSSIVGWWQKRCDNPHCRAISDKSKLVIDKPGLGEPTHPSTTLPIHSLA